MLYSHPIRLRPESKREKPKDSSISVARITDCSFSSEEVSSVVRSEEAAMECEEDLYCPLLRRFEEDWRELPYLEGLRTGIVKVEVVCRECIWEASMWERGSCAVCTAGISCYQGFICDWSSRCRLRCRMSSARSVRSTMLNWAVNCGCNECPKYEHTHRGLQVKSGVVPLQNASTSTRLEKHFSTRPTRVDPETLRRSIARTSKPEISKLKVNRRR